MSNIILVPTDFSEVCANAVQHGVELARQFKNNLCLLHVIDKHTRTWLQKSGQGNAYVDEKLLEIAESIKLRNNIVVQTIAREGDIFKTISEVASEVEAELMILGTHGKTGMQKITGSYALKVITRSPVPVIVVHKPRFIKWFSKIVFPIDSSYATRQKVAWAVHIAGKYKSEVNLFQIRESSDDIKHKLLIITDQIISVMKKNRIRYKLQTAEKEGGFAAQVNQFATDIEADLIMIMTNSNEGFPYFTLGPWDEKIIFNTAKIPVMCINPYPYDYITTNY